MPKLTEFLYRTVIHGAHHRPCIRPHVRIATPPCRHAKLLVAHQRPLPFRGLEPQTIAKIRQDSPRLIKTRQDSPRLAKICNVNANLSHEHTNAISTLQYMTHTRYTCTKSPAVHYIRYYTTCTIIYILQRSTLTYRKLTHFFCQYDINDKLFLCHN